jgi:hypothetical protein
MSIINRIKVFIIISPLILFIGAVIGFYVNSYFDARAGEHFYSISKGQSQDSVIDIFGEPDTIRPCGENLWWGLEFSGKNTGECVTEVRYEYFLSAWSFGYNSDGKVISKFHYASE